MNQYLTNTLNAIGIDTTHLQNEYLNTAELRYLDTQLTSKHDFTQDFYTDSHGKNLECLLYFLSVHKDDIADITQGKDITEAMIRLYVSDAISGNYDCFRFDLSKFKQTYQPQNTVLELFRIGREGECAGNLGCSWSLSMNGLKAYCQSSSLCELTLQSRPVFSIKVDDSQVLFQGKSSEQEYVLKPNFIYENLSNINY